MKQAVREMLRARRTPMTSAELAIAIHAPALEVASTLRKMLLQGAVVVMQRDPDTNECRYRETSIGECWLCGYYCHRRVDGACAVCRDRVEARETCDVGAAR